MRVGKSLISLDVVVEQAEGSCGPTMLLSAQYTLY
jgi:hypothetical protein